MQTKAEKIQIALDQRDAMSAIVRYAIERAPEPLSSELAALAIAECIDWPSRMEARRTRRE